MEQDDAKTGKRFNVENIFVCLFSFLGGREWAVEGNWHVKCWKVAHWNAKKLLPEFQKLRPEFLD